MQYRITLHGVVLNQEIIETPRSYLRHEPPVVAQRRGGCGTTCNEALETANENEADIHSSRTGRLGMKIKALLFTG
jgi:hypothetical protein